MAPACMRIQRWALEPGAALPTAHACVAVGHLGATGVHHCYLMLCAGLCLCDEEHAYDCDTTLCKL